MAIIKFVILYLFLISIIIGFYTPSQAAFVLNDAARNQIRRAKLLASEANSKRLKNANQVDPKRDCREINSRSDCGQNPKCRWCRSDALDDMCFSKSEAWRLPSQISSSRPNLLRHGKIFILGWGEVDLFSDSSRLSWFLRCEISTNVSCICTMATGAKLHWR